MKTNFSAASLLNLLDELEEVSFSHTSAGAFGFIEGGCLYCRFGSVTKTATAYEKAKGFWDDFAQCLQKQGIAPAPILEAIVQKERGVTDPCSAYEPRGILRIIAEQADKGPEAAKFAPAEGMKGFLLQVENGTVPLDQVKNHPFVQGELLGNPQLDEFLRLVREEFGGPKGPCLFCERPKQAARLFIWLQALSLMKFEDSRRQRLVGQMLTERDECCRTSYSILELNLFGEI